MATCAGWVEPLNLQCLLVNIFAGDMIIFFFIGFFVLAAMAARFQMRDEVALLGLGLFGLIFSQYLSGLTTLVVLVIGLLVFSMMKRSVARN